MDIRIRPATPADIHGLRGLIAASVRGLQTGDYSSDQIERALATVYGVDTQLIADGTYYVAEAYSAAGSSSVGLSAVGSSNASGEVVVGCGGWSKRKTLYGADHCAGREDALLDPRVDAARIRAFFIHPNWARMGIGSMILETCERAARSAGFTRLEMGATLTGVPFYQAKGYSAFERIDVPLGDGVTMPVVRMGKRV